jgi:hypothetical protein
MRTARCFALTFARPPCELRYRGCAEELCLLFEPFIHPRVHACTPFPLGRLGNDHPRIRLIDVQLSSRHHLRRKLLPSRTAQRAY